MISRIGKVFIASKSCLSQDKECCFVYGFSHIEQLSCQDSTAMYAVCAWLCCVDILVFLILIDSLMSALPGFRDQRIDGRMCAY